MMGRRWGVSALAGALMLTATALAAEPVTVSIMAEVPPGADARPVSWSVVPLDLPPEADVLAAMLVSPEPIEGPWQVQLEPGRYVISGFTEVELYEREAEVTSQTPQIAVPVLSIEPTVALRCEDAAGCAFADPDTGLQAMLPVGWAVDVPYRADLGLGQTATEVSTVFFEDVEGDGGTVWFLNPVDWIDDDTGPCRDVAVGVLCTFDLSPAAEAAFTVIAPSLAVVR